MVSNRLKVLSNGLNTAFINASESPPNIWFDEGFFNSGQRE